MSRFNSEAYDKLFPRTPDPVPVVESPVETFRPSQTKPGEAPVEAAPEPSTDFPVDPVTVIAEEQEVNYDDGSPSQPDSE